MYCWVGECVSFGGVGGLVGVLVCWWVGVVWVMVVGVDGWWVGVFVCWCGWGGGEEAGGGGRRTRRPRRRRKKKYDSNYGKHQAPVS